MLPRPLRTRQHGPLSANSRWNRVLEDVTGVGHMTWTDPTSGWVLLFIPLDADTTLA
jgi:hypothetical protein